MIEIVSANASEIATVIAHVIVTAIDPETETATAKEIVSMLGQSSDDTAIAAAVQEGMK